MVKIGVSGIFYIEHDVLELIRNFVRSGAREKNIVVSLAGFRDVYKMEETLTHTTTK